MPQENGSDVDGVIVTPGKKKRKKRKNHNHGNNDYHKKGARFTNGLRTDNCPLVPTGRYIDRKKVPAATTNDEEVTV